MSTFCDSTLAAIFAIVLSCLSLGAKPKRERVAVVLSKIKGELRLSIEEMELKLKEVYG